jgi:nucleotide-binding universal stress UspA family protein
VLVVRRAPKDIRRIVIGVDGSPKARRAVELAARFKPGRGAKITVVRVVEPLSVPTAVFLPASMKASVRQRVRALNAERMRRTRREMQVVVARLTSAGWSSRMEVRSGAPLAELLDAVEQCGGDLLVVGARAARGLERALLGSVAEGALNLSPVPVLVVR